MHQPTFFRSLEFLSDLGCGREPTIYIRIVGVYVVSSSSSFSKVENPARCNPAPTLVLVATSPRPHPRLTTTYLTMIAPADLNMILRDLSAFNMGRGAYDTTGVKKPGAPPPPPK